MPETPYELDPAFERAVVYLACSSKKFFDRIGGQLEPKCLEAELSEKIIEAALAIRVDTEQAPGSTSVVLQRLKLWHLEGRLKYETLEAALDYFEDAENSGLPEIDIAINELAPILRQRATDDAVRQAIKLTKDENPDPDEVEAVATSFAKVSRIGKKDDSLGVIFKPRNFGAIEILSQGDRLKFGYNALENALGGGFMRGAAHLIAAASGGGKSTSMTHISALGGWAKGMPVAYATFELAEGQIEAKYRAAVTSTPLNDVLTDPRARTRTADVIEQMEAEQGHAFGGLAIKKFTARVHTWEDVVAWIKDLADSWGMLPPVVCVDFLAKMGHKNRKQSTYEAQAWTMDAMHEWAEENYLWLFTASQPQRGKKERKVIGIDDLNESQGKIEGCDTFLSANKREEGTEIYWWIGKNRFGPSDLGIGPHAHDFGFARIIAPGWENLAEGRDDEESLEGQASMW